MHVTIRLLFAICLLSASQALPAEEPEKRDPEDERVFESEIEVTATRRPEKVQEVPVAITAFSEAALEARSMHDLTDVADFTPNLDFSVSGGAGGAPSEATVYLRGVGQIETGIMADPGVGIYVDGVYVARSQGAVLDLLDLERVEVLRGPQGTLFGKNTTGGAIRLVTKKPDGVFGGDVGATLGSFDRRDAALRVDGALTEKLFASFAAQTTNRDGYVSSLVTGRELNNENRDSLRAALRLLPSDNLLVDVTVEAMSERETALDQTMIALFGSPVLDFTNRVRADNGLFILDEAFITGDVRRSFSDGPSLNDGDVALASLRFTYTGPRFDLLSITAYRDYEFEGASDFDGTPVRFFERSYVQTQDQFSQEVQLSGSGAENRLSWVAGAIYFEENPVDDSVAFTFDNTFELLESAPGPIYTPPGGDPSHCDPGPPPDGVVCMGGAGNPANFFFFNGDGQVDLLDVSTTSWAAFGELTWAVSERLSLTAGLRYTYEEKETTFTSFVAPLDEVRTELAEERDWEAWSPRLALSYRVRDSVLWYVSAAHGFKSGGFNAARSAVAAEVLVPFDQEDLWAFETGVKSDLGPHLRLNAALFHYEYDDVQFGATIDPARNPTFTILNAADARIRGFEAELEALPAERSTIIATLGYVDSEYEELRNPGGAPSDGVFPKTPRWQASLSAQQAFTVGGSGAFILRGDYSWRDDFFHDVTNSPFLRQDAYGLFHARVSYLPPSGQWEFALFGTNLSDEAYFEHGFFALGAGQATAIAGRPREWGFSVQWRFK